MEAKGPDSVPGPALLLTGQHIPVTSPLWGCSHHSQNHALGTQVLQNLDSAWPTSRTCLNPGWRDDKMPAGRVERSPASRHSGITAAAHTPKPPRWTSASWLGLEPGVWLSSAQRSILSPGPPRLSLLPFCPLPSWLRQPFGLLLRA